MMRFKPRCRPLHVLFFALLLGVVTRLSSSTAFCPPVRKTSGSVITRTTTTEDFLHHLKPSRRTWSLQFHQSSSSDATAVRTLARSTRLYDSSMSQEGGGGGLEQDSSSWNPTLRRLMGGIALTGVLETAYLTWNKLSESVTTGDLPFCDAATGGAAGAGCSSVLNGPYSVIPGTENTPLALVGLVAYAGAAFLALAPTFSKSSSEDDNKNDETTNRIALTAWTTTMGIFSTFLMILLLGFLQETCVYCIASAALSITLATTCWLGGAIPRDRLQQGIQISVGGGGFTAFIAMISILVLNAPESSRYITSVQQQQQREGSLSSFMGSSPGRLVASSGASVIKGLEPPPITAQSSQRAMTLVNDLERLDARLYGAYWCSHCYDQKQRLGQSAMAKIPYIECSKDGANSQTKLCKEKNVPGYPTWEINGQLYPGEQALDELEELVSTATTRSRR